MTQNSIINTVFLTLCGWFLIHFTIILINVGPVTPLSIDLNEKTENYINPIFSQNWHLFAPDPVKDNYYLYIQAKNNEAVADSTTWIDITRPLIENNHSSLITPFNRIIRIYSGLVSSFVGGISDDLLFKLYKKADDRNLLHKQFKKNLERDKKRSKEKVEEELFRYCASFSKSIFNTQKFEKIRFRIDIVTEIPFSERNNPNYTRKSYTHISKWKSLDKYALVESIL
jgi:hypothetical protein